MKRSMFAILSLLLVASLVLAACGATEEPVVEPEPTEAVAEPTAAEPSEPAEPGVEVGFAVMPGGYLEKALAGEYTGTTVVVDGPFTDVDEVVFNESMKAFEEATGIDINYIGNKEFEGSISIRVDAGDAPDIADFPQPGLLAG
ncbi:MAG: carbohydrate ABC transporter substrate-binding protein, partial [Anaerolineae bacterium]|nr:carbohydrate ABC transporter substrate-binding protein [Anaerolineae bacterium]